MIALALDWKTGLTIATCSECKASANCGKRLQHRLICPDYAQPRALRVGGRIHIMHCSYPAIEEALIAEDIERTKGIAANV